jgi:plasmid stabilization system protein ParE
MGYRPGPDPERQMNRDLVVLPEAEADLADAYTWHEERLPGLGSAFLLSVEAVINSISRNPQLYSLVHKNVRRALVRRFPYAVFYIVEESHIAVLAIFHAKRHPATWRKRSK